MKELQESEAHMLELTLDETDQVAGGIAPFVAAAVGIAMNTTARSLASAVISRGMSIYGVYSAASAYGGAGRNRRIVINQR